jgi:opacity protein-like surface antigen
MKASKILVGSLIGMIVLGWLPAQAAPRAAEASGANYLIAAEDLDTFHFGGFYRYQQRDTDLGELTQNKGACYIGYDLLPWASIFGEIATTRVKLGLGENSDAASEFGGGAWFNLLDHDILGNLTMETRVRLQALAQVSHASPEVNGTDISYTEFYGSLTMSLVTEVVGNKNYWPDAVGLFFGPVYNSLDSSNLDSEDSGIGFIAGLDFNITRGITISLSYEVYESDGAMNAGFDFRF